MKLLEFKYQAQLLHQLFFKELVQPTPEEIWFLIGNKRRRFGIGEFALMTGLSCSGDLDKSQFRTRVDSFKEFYFKDFEKLTKADLETVFLLSQYRTDEEAVNMAALYFINNFLFFKDKLKLVDEDNIQICASMQFDEYPWGRSLFNMTLKFIQSQLKEKVLKVRKGKMKNE